jgi:hypothetical protein
VMGKTIKTIQVYHNFTNIFNYKIFHILCSWNIFKVWLLISNFTLFKDLILNQLHVNHKSHISKPTITMYHTKVLKSLRFLVHFII